ncbi:MAG: hypothetical protein R3C11_28130 [Planctomycetaceae bacterium]
MTLFQKKWLGYRFGQKAAAGGDRAGCFKLTSKLLEKFTMMNQLDRLPRCSPSPLNRLNVCSQNTTPENSARRKYENS